MTKKIEIIKNYAIHEKDCGSTEVQVALLTDRIQYLTNHVKIHHKDNHSRRGLVKLAAKRRILLSYLKNRNFESYSNLISNLKIRAI